MADEPFVVVGREALGFTIEKLWLVVAVHGDGDEGVAAFCPPGGNMMMPLVAADEARLEQVIRKARDLAKATGLRLRLVRFDARTVVEVLHPDGRRERSG